MAKTQEELNALKEEVETVSKKLHELTDEELAQVSGGAKIAQVQSNEFVYTPPTVPGPDLTTQKSFGRPGCQVIVECRGIECPQYPICYPEEE